MQETTYELKAVHCCLKAIYLEAATGGILQKKMFLKCWLNSQEKTFNTVSLLIKLQLYWKRDSRTGVSCWILRIFSEHLFIEHLWTNASVHLIICEGVFVTPLVESYRHRGISNILIWEGIVCSRPVNSTGAAERLRILIDFSNSPSLPSYSPDFTCSLTWNNLWLGNYFICFLKPVMINEIILRVRKNIVYPENIELKITVPNPGIAFIVYPLRFIQ